MVKDSVNIKTPKTPQLSNEYGSEFGVEILMWIGKVKNGERK